MKAATTTRRKVDRQDDTVVTENFSRLALHLCRSAKVLKCQETGEITKSLNTESVQKQEKQQNPFPYFVIFPVSRQLSHSKDFVIFPVST